MVQSFIRETSKTIHSVKTETQIVCDIDFMPFKFFVVLPATRLAKTVPLAVVMIDTDRYARYAFHYVMRFTYPQDDMYKCSSDWSFRFNGQ